MPVPRNQSGSDQEAAADSVESGEQTDPQSDRTKPAFILTLAGGGRLNLGFPPAQHHRCNVKHQQREPDQQLVLVHNLSDR
jgi:hypothetical protein